MQGGQVLGLLQNRCLHTKMLQSLPNFSKLDTRLCSLKIQELDLFFVHSKSAETTVIALFKSKKYY